ncbi:hypothetical protein [Desulfosporosinus metallidurans]|uniref:hypothetical protein n=1 Tax=Desulfosporosinus metallidurans TaxID=1888891 RepID=UPI00094D566B|nr:hypothetical protein [Desulfosporosinus metallidurans]
MEKLKKYCTKNGLEFSPNCDGGITIYVPIKDSERVIKYIKRIPGVSYNPLESWSNYACGFKMLPVFGLS